MTTEDKELLLKDLCARLPYNPLVEYKGESYNVLGIAHERLVLCKPFMSYTLKENPLVEEVKPYLFPLSSMSEEQIVEFDKIAELDIEYSITQIKNDVLIWTSGLNRFNWLLKNHFDVYGLIDKGLAIDATNLNIY